MACEQPADETTELVDAGSAGRDPRRWRVLLSYSFFAACNGFMWMDYSTVSDVSKAALHTGTGGLNWLYSASLVVALPSILLVMALLDAWNWPVMLAGVGATVAAAWLRYVALVTGSYACALVSSLCLGHGVGAVLANFTEVPCRWFVGREQMVARGVTVQSNFLGWGFGALVVPLAVKTEADLQLLCLIQAGVCSLSLVTFLAGWADEPGSGAPESRHYSVVEDQQSATTREPSIQGSKLSRAGSKLSQVHSDAYTSFVFFTRTIFCRPRTLAIVLACMMLQAIGFSIPAVQDQIFEDIGYSHHSSAVTNTAFIFSGVAVGLLLGRWAPDGDGARRAVVVALFFAGAAAIGGLQALSSLATSRRGSGLNHDAQYAVFVCLMSVAGGCSLGYLNLMLPLVCAECPVPRVHTGGLVECVGQGLAAAVTQLSTGREFWVCLGAAAFAAFAAAVPPPPRAAAEPPCEAPRGPPPPSPRPPARVSPV